MSDIGLAVPSMGRRDLRAVAARLRRLFDLHDDAWFPIVEVLEHSLPSLAPGFIFEVMTMEHMGDDHGLTRLDERRVWLREDVYDRACEGHGRDRFTAAHELGHALLHADVAFARRIERQVPAYECPEWQANCFAGELLVSARVARDFVTIADAADAFGVSWDAASVQYRAFAKEGIVELK
jgi:hypothetical protein